MKTKRYADRRVTDTIVILYTMRFKDLQLSKKKQNIDKYYGVFKREYEMMLDKAERELNIHMTLKAGKLTINITTNYEPIT